MIVIVTWLASIKWKMLIKLDSAIVPSNDQFRIKDTNLTKKTKHDLIKKIYIAQLWFIIATLITDIIPFEVDANLHRLADQTNENTPTFLIDRTVCNYNENPIQIYTFERLIKNAEILRDVKIEYSLLGECTIILLINDHLFTEQISLIANTESIIIQLGELDDKFTINLETEVRTNGDYQLVELVLSEPLQIRELMLQLNAIRFERKGLEKDSKETVCEIKFNLTIEDCNSITWQTLTVIILASLSVLLFSTFAIMLSLYQQKNSNNCHIEPDDDLETYEDGDQQDDLNDYDDNSRGHRDSSDCNNNSSPEDSSYNLHNTNMFISPRRNSSHDSSNHSRNSNSNVDDLNETKL